MKPYYVKGDVTLYVGDCREVAPTIGTVDHVITDPPYSTRTHKTQRSVRGERLEDYTIPFQPLDDWTMPFVCSIPRRRWLLVFCDSMLLTPWLEATGDRRSIAIWWRRLDGRPQYTGDHPAIPGEYIVAAHTKGRRRWNGGGAHGYIEAPTVKRKGRHPTEKPLAVMHRLITWFTDPGELILDPFAGAGTTLVAAYELGRKAIGIELEERYAEMAARRLEFATAPLPGIATAEATQAALDLFD